MFSGEARRYHVLSVLGRGSFGTVYRARVESDGGFAQSVALKLLHPDKESDPDLARRLREEARVLGLVRHRAIVQVLGLANLSGRWALVMELVEGVDLRQVVSRGPVPARVAAALVAEIASALHVAWTTPGPDGAPLHLIHRDVKPSNLFLTPHGEVKILDFGIARLDAQEPEDESVGTFGTEAYMSPERRDLRDGPEGDVYALGAVLYELVTGEMLGKTFLRAERHDERLTERLSLIPEEGPAGVTALRQLVQEMLAFDPAARPTAADIRRRCLKLASELPGPDLEDWAEGIAPKLMEARVAEAPTPDDPVGSTLVERPLTNPEATRLPTPPAPPAPAVSAARAAPEDGAPEDGPPGDDPGDGPAPEATESSEHPSWLYGAWGGLAVALVLAGGVAWWLFSTPPAPMVAPADIAPVETTVRPAPDPSVPVPTGVVRIEGDATAVELRGGGRVSRGGTVPAGSYELWADLGGGLRPQGSVAVPGGATVVVKCSAVSGRCTPRAASP